MSFLLRPRIASQVVSGANQRIQHGTFGDATPLVDEFAVDPRSASIYRYSQGDVFFPGAGNWVFEPNFELPLVTLWGHAFIRNPNTFNPIQPPQVWAQPNVATNGIGGLEAGYLELQPLLDPSGESAVYQNSGL